jgi:heme A synthase
MRAIYYAHSGLRYLVLLVGVLAAAYFAYGHFTKQPAGKGVRVLGSMFAGLLDLQILLGVVLVVSGLYYPALIGHIVLMLAAAGLVHALLVVNRKRPTPGFLLPLVAVGGGLLLILGGILAIRASPFASQAFNIAAGG